MTRGRVCGSGRSSSGIDTGASAANGRAPKSFAGSWSSKSDVTSGARPYGSGQAVMQRPQAEQSSRFRTTGISPVWGLISVPSSMQCLAQASMQRPQPLQYSGSRKGLGFSAVVGMRGSPFGVQSVQTPRQAPHAIHQWHRRHDAPLEPQLLRRPLRIGGRSALSTTCRLRWSDQNPQVGRSVAGPPSPRLPPARRAPDLAPPLGRQAPAGDRGRRRDRRRARRTA